MRNILLVEPDYRSKFPPLGLMRISSYHKMRGDTVHFVRGKDVKSKNRTWHRIYVSSLFTWELPRTVETAKYYSLSVSDPGDIIVGGVGATLFPDYLKRHLNCRIIEGTLDQPGQLDPLSQPVAKHPLDYSLLEATDYNYHPKDAYFCRITIGCIRKCKFCAVPILEPRFGLGTSLPGQVKQIQMTSGDKQHIVFLDNNVLGIEGLESTFAEIRDLGFLPGARRNGRARYVDFNQGLDARLMTTEKAKLLASIPISPVRLAFDHDGIEKPYRNAIQLLSDAGLEEFTNYLLFNFVDAPESLFKRIQINKDLNERLGVKITGFPMRFIPMDDVKRGHVSKLWPWRYLRGMQCILLATRGLVSPNSEFVDTAFGETVEQFFEILAMPDRYIIWRKHFSPEALDWQKLYRRLSDAERGDFLQLLQHLNKSRSRETEVLSNQRFRSLLEHYYPGGKTPPNRPVQSILDAQGLSTGYDAYNDEGEIEASGELVGASFA